MNIPAIVIRVSAYLIHCFRFNPQAVYAESREQLGDVFFAVNVQHAAYGRTESIAFVL